jgi:predicted DNA-binding transcriptional regulator AlpA
MGTIRKSKSTKTNLLTSTKQPRAMPINAPEAVPASAPDLIMAARLSKRLGVSDVTLWRWRHDERSGFPKGRRINRRVYFPWHEVVAWLDRQQKVA